MPPSLVDDELTQNNHTQTSTSHAKTTKTASTTLRWARLGDEDESLCWANWSIEKEESTHIASSCSTKGKSSEKKHGKRTTDSCGLDARYTSQECRTVLGIRDQEILDPKAELRLLREIHTHQANDIQQSEGTKTSEHINSTTIDSEEDFTEETLRADLEALDLYTRGLRNERKAQETELESLRAQIQASNQQVTEPDDAESFSYKLHSLEVKLASYKPLVATMKSESKAKDNEITSLKQQVKALEGERDAKAPLVDIGSSVRLHFLEQARSKLTPGKLRYDHAFTKTGNSSAHHGKGEADTALYYNILTCKQKQRFYGVFRELYKCQPKGYPETSELLKETINHEATIKTLTALNDGLGSLKARQTALDLIGVVYEKFEKLGKERFEGDEAIEALLVRIRGLTEEIVEADRMKKGDS